jgi:hypothetical protein
MASANAAYATKPLTETLTLGHGDLKLQVNGHRLDGFAPKLPAFSTELFYRAYAYSFDPAPVATVILYLDDSARRIVIDGQSAEQVDAVYATLKSDLLALSSQFGGPFIRAVLWCVMSLPFQILLVVPLVFAFVEDKKPRILPMLLGCIGFIIIYMLPLADVFAGFYLCASNPSLLSRYAPLVAYLSFLIAVIGMLRWVVPKMFPSGTPPLSTAASEGPPPEGQQKPPTRQAAKKRKV